MKRIKFIDTLLLAKLYISDKERLSQSKLCSKYNIVNESEHRALGDVIALEILYEHLCYNCSKAFKKEDNYMLENPEEIIFHCCV